MANIVTLYDDIQQVETGTRSMNDLLNVFTKKHNVFVIDSNEFQREQRLVTRRHTHALASYQLESWDDVEQEFPQEEPGNVDVVFYRHSRPKPGDDPKKFSESVQEVANTYSNALHINEPSTVLSLDKHYMKEIAAIDPSFTPSTLYSADADEISDYVASTRDVILKPVDGFAGEGIRRVQADSDNLGSLIDTLSDGGSKQIIAQEYLPQISQGDKRVVYVNGGVVGQYSRIPQENSIFGNVAKGAFIKPSELTAREEEIVERLAPKFEQDGIYFAGLNFIGEKLNEVNVVDPGFSYLSRQGKVERMAERFEDMFPQTPMTTEVYSLDRKPFSNFQQAQPSFYFF